MENVEEKEVVFDKESHRRRIADIKRATCRVEHISAELNGLNNKVNGLREKLERAEALLEKKNEELLPELESLETLLKEGA